MLIEYIERLRREPLPVRQQAVVFWTAVIAGTIVFLWLIIQGIIVFGATEPEAQKLHIRAPYESEK